VNPELSLLQPYPFEKLKKLFKDSQPPPHLKNINLSLGEPQDETPDFIIQAMTTALPSGLKKYPTTQGGDNLRCSITHWLTQRFNLPANLIQPSQQVLPVNGTREALFAIAQCLIDRTASRPLVLIPNPFYQIYEGATLLAGAQPWYINCLADNNFQPDFASIPKEIWLDCQLVYICSPNNPSGTIIDLSTWQYLFEMSDKYNFIIVADECYSEIYADETQPPIGLLQAAVLSERLDFKRCIVFHSLSKRSNAPGLRSGFVAGDRELLKRFLLYRTYHGCSMSLPVQAASIAAWQDETHVQTNRALYREKYQAVIDILQPVMPVTYPPASFYLWLQTPIPDEEFARELFAQQNITVLPGSYLSRMIDGINPGYHRIRVALVAPLDICIEAAQRIRQFIQN